MYTVTKYAFYYSTYRRKLPYGNLVNKEPNDKFPQIISYNN